MTGYVARIIDAGFDVIANLDKIESSVYVACEVCRLCGRIVGDGLLSFLSLFREVFEVMRV